jgi:hypothetical protein
MALLVVILGVHTPLGAMHVPWRAHKLESFLHGGVLRKQG